MLLRIIAWATLPDYKLANDIEVRYEALTGNYLHNTETEYVHCQEKYSAQEWNPINCANLRGMEIIGDDISSTDMRHVLLCYATLDDATFRNVSMFDANLDGASCLSIVFENVNLDCATFSNANFMGSRITNVQCRYSTGRTADFTKSIITNSSFSGNIRERQIFWNFTKKDALPELLYSDGSDLSFSKFVRAKLTNVEFMGTNLQYSRFTEAMLENVNFISANIKKASFKYTTLDSASIIKGDYEIKPESIVDEDTDFTGTSLESFRLDPLIKNIIEKNIRKKYWNCWYLDHKILRWPLKLFWYISDYGTSAKRVIISFIILFIVALLTNICLGDIVECTPYELIGKTILSIFGFGNPVLSGAFVLLSALYSVTGYFLLAVLITRFGLMFRNLTP